MVRPMTREMYETFDRYEYGEYVDLKGNLVERTPKTNPYNYDMYVLWKSREYDENKRYGSSYSDRMQSWNSKKFSESWKGICEGKGAYVANSDPVAVNKFLNRYFGKEVNLVAIMQGCNHGSGYPFWYYVYEE